MENNLAVAAFAVSANAFDLALLQREFLVGDAFVAKFSAISRDFIWQEQNERFKQVLARAWRMGFYRRLWGAHGVKPGDVRSLLDIAKLPMIDATDLSAANDFAGLDSYSEGLAPEVLPALSSVANNIFGPRGHAVQALLQARADVFQAPLSTELARYQINSAGVVGIEGPDQAGLYVMEDAHFIEILSPAGLATTEGTAGELIATTLYKNDIAPLIRFNSQDRAQFLTGESTLGLNLQRIYLAELKN